MALFSHGGLKLSYENSDLECISFSSLLILTKEKICWVNESPFSTLIILYGGFGTC